MPRPRPCSCACCNAWRSGARGSPGWSLRCIRCASNPSHGFQSRRTRSRWCSTCSRCWPPCASTSNAGTHPPPGPAPAHAWRYYLLATALFVLAGADQVGDRHAARDVARAGVVAARPDLMAARRRAVPAVVRARDRGGPVHRVGGAQIYRGGGRGLRPERRAALPSGGPRAVVLPRQVAVAGGPELRLSPLAHGRLGCVGVCRRSRSPGGARRTVAAPPALARATRRRVVFCRLAFPRPRFLQRLSLHLFLCRGPFPISRLPRRDRPGVGRTGIRALVTRLAAVSPPD